MRLSLVLLGLGLLLGLGCARPQPFVWYSALPKPEKLAARTTISPGDKIMVQVDQHPELSGEFVVGMSGEYNQPTAGLVQVAGKDAMSAAEVIKIKLLRFYQDLRVSVTLLDYRPIDVTVLGEVRAAGSYELPHGASVLAALGKAGGLGEFAGEEEIYVLRSHPKVQRIRFRYDDLTKPEPAALNFELRDGDTVLVE